MTGFREGDSVVRSYMGAHFLLVSRHILVSSRNMEGKRIITQV